MTSSSKDPGVDFFKNAMKEIKDANPEMASYISTFLAAPSYNDSYAAYQQALAYHNQYPNPSYQTTEYTCYPAAHGLACANQPVTVDVHEQYQDGVNRLHTATNNLTSTKNSIVTASTDLINKGIKALLDLKWAFTYYQFHLPECKATVSFTVYFQEDIAPFLPYVPQVVATSDSLFGSGSPVGDPNGYKSVQRFADGYGNWPKAETNFSKLCTYFDAIWTSSDCN